MRDVANVRNVRNVGNVGNVGGVTVDALGRLRVAAGTGVRCVELPD